MPKYMYSGNYTKEGAAGLLKDGGKARKEEAERIVEAMGCLLYTSDAADE